MRLHIQATLFSRFIVAGLILLNAIIITGCGSDVKQGDTSEKAEVKSATSSPAKPLQETRDYLPAMYLERSEFLDTSAIKYKDKLVFRLSLQKDSSCYLLSLFESGKSGKGFDETKAKYPKPFANELPVLGVEHVFDEHHTKENDFQALWDEVKRYTLVKYIIFEPEVDSNKHFCYKITGVEKLPLDLMAHGFATKTYYSHPSSHVWK